jgi:hypothetical protein
LNLRIFFKPKFSNFLAHTPKLWRMDVEIVGGGDVAGMGRLTGNNHRLFIELHRCRPLASRCEQTNSGRLAQI